MECKTARADTLVNDEGVGPGCLRFSKSNHGALIQLLHQMHI